MKQRNDKKFMQIHTQDDDTLYTTDTHTLTHPH